MDLGQIVRRKGEHGGLYRVMEIREDGDIDCFGGPHRQWRTFRPDMLKSASSSDTRQYEIRYEQEAELRRAIRPARALRLNTRKAAS